MTTIEMIRHVQRELRLPQSSSVSEPHAQLILSFLNKTQRVFMLEAIVWDELKRYGYFDTEAGKANYTVSVINNGEIDVIRSLKIGEEPLVKLSDEEFRKLNKTHANGKPLYYRHLGRVGGSVIIELWPIPDDEYQIDAEVLIKPPMLVNDNDVPLLDPDTIILGAIALAKEEQGENFQSALAAFQAKLGLQADTQGESNWGDVEPV